MKKIRVGLLARIIIAILLGVVAGNFFPEPIVRFFITFNYLFSQFLNFAIPLIIVGLVTVAIANIGDKAGRLLLITVGIAYGSTLFAGFFSYFTGAALFPSMIESGASFNTVSEAEELLPFFTVNIPPLMDVMTALVLAFVFGLGLAGMGESILKGAAQDFETIISKVIARVIIPILPVYIFGIFLNMTHSGRAYSILLVFIKIIAVIFAVHIAVLLIQYSIAGLLTKRNPFSLLKRMLPAYFTALGTQSSAATIPVTLAQAIKNGASPQIAGFVVPLCATIHLSGSTLKIVACALALMIVQDMPHNFSMFAGFICLLGIAMVAAPGVPGGAIMAALGVLHTVLGFDDSMQALMIALYIAMDSFGTACNVTGDGAIALVVDKLQKRVNNT